MANYSSKIDRIYTLKEHQVTCDEYKIALHTLFMDFKQVHDKVNGEQIHIAMRWPKIYWRQGILISRGLDK